MVIFATILFILSFLVIASMFLVKFAHIHQRPVIKLKIIGAGRHYYETLWPYMRRKLSLVGGRIWHFILEAKDLAPAPTKTLHAQATKVKNAFRIRIRGANTEPQWLPEATELSIKPTVNQNPEDLYLEEIKNNPSDKQAYEHLGRLYLQNKNFTDAVEIYEYLIKLDAGHDIYFSNLGLSLYSLGEYKKAAAAYEKALNINNKIPTRWINLGLCFEALEEYTKAVKALASALQLDKTNVNYLTLLADIYIKLENNVRAEEVLEQILLQDPTNRSAREKLMRIKI